MGFIMKLSEQIEKTVKDAGGYADINSICNGTELQREIVMREIRRSCFLKKEKYSEVVEYKESGFLPPKYEDILFHGQSPENVEEALFKYALDFGEYPDRESAKVLFSCFSFSFSVESYKSAKKKVNKLVKIAKGV